MAVNVMPYDDGRAHAYDVYVAKGVTLSMCPES